MDALMPTTNNRRLTRCSPSRMPQPLVLLIRSRKRMRATPHESSPRTRPGPSHHLVSHASSSRTLDRSKVEIGRHILRIKFGDKRADRQLSPALHDYYRKGCIRLCSSKEECSRLRIFQVFRRTSLASLWRSRFIVKPAVERRAAMRNAHALIDCRDGNMDAMFCRKYSASFVPSRSRTQVVPRLVARLSSTSLLIAGVI